MPYLPTARLLWLALAVAIPLALASLEPAALGLALVSFGCVATAVAVDLRAMPARAAFTVRREHEPRLSIGESNAVELRVALTPSRRLRSDRPLRLWARDEAPPAIPVDQRVLGGAVPAGGEWVGRYHLRPPRRGCYRFGDLFLRVQTPLGFLVRQQTVPLAGPVSVYPNLRAIRRYELLALRGRQQEAGLRHSRRFGEGTEFERLRDYLPDDDFRRIAWKATARRRQPVTIEYETERSQSLMLVLDTGRLMSTPVGPLQKLDYAINTALLLARVATQMGDRVGVLAYSDQVNTYVPPGKGRPQFLQLLELLAKVGAQPVEANHARALNLLGLRQTKRSLVVLFTDLVEAIEADVLVRQLGALSRRHLPLCVMISDPDVHHLAERPPQNARQAYELVTARRLLEERRAVLERIERRGGLVLDVPADKLTASVVNRYLEVKARTKL